MRLFFITYILFRICFGINLVTDTMIGTISFFIGLKTNKQQLYIFFGKIKQQRLVYFLGK